MEFVSGGSLDEIVQNAINYFVLSSSIKSFSIDNARKVVVLNSYDVPIDIEVFSRLKSLENEIERHGFSVESSYVVKLGKDSSATVASKVYGVDESSKKALDVQIGGDHYKKLAIQPVEYIFANKIPYLEGNVIKYVTRHSEKGGKKDIEKAIHYLQMILEMEYKN